MGIFRGRVPPFFGLLFTITIVLTHCLVLVTQIENVLGS